MLQRCGGHKLEEPHGVSLKWQTGSFQVCYVWIDGNLVCISQNQIS